MKQVCCCSLATACIVIGILGIIYSFSEVVFPVRTIAAGKETSPYRVWLCQELNESQCLSRALILRLFGLNISSDDVYRQNMDLVVRRLIIVDISIMGQS